MARSIGRGAGRPWFDPDRLANLEASGWRAYYDRAWARLLLIVHAICREQLRIPFPVSVVAAYHVVRAAVDWAPVDHDPARVRARYERFYRLARRFSGRRFDPRRVAALELRYNDVHRRSAGQADKRALFEAMVELHAEAFGLPPERARESAGWRVAANSTVDLITSQRSRDVAADWARVEALLRRCYRSVERELGRGRAAEARPGSDNGPLPDRRAAQ